MYYSNDGEIKLRLTEMMQFFWDMNHVIQSFKVNDSNFSHDLVLKKQTKIAIHHNLWSLYFSRPTWSNCTADEQMKSETQTKSHLCVVLCAVAAAVQVVLDATHVTTTADTIADTTEVAMIAMTTGTTTDHTGDCVNLFCDPDSFGFLVCFFCINTR